MGHEAIRSHVSVVLFHFELPYCRGFEWDLLANHSINSSGDCLPLLLAVIDDWMQFGANCDSLHIGLFLDSNLTPRLFVLKWDFPLKSYEGFRELTDKAGSESRRKQKLQVYKLLVFAYIFTCG